MLLVCYVLFLEVLSVFFSVHANQFVFSSSSRLLSPLMSSLSLSTPFLPFFFFLLCGVVFFGRVVQSFCGGIPN